MKTIWFCVVLGVAGSIPKFASAAEFPVFDGSSCIKLTSKMLDPIEKADETEKCWKENDVARDRLVEHWSLVTDADLADCMKYQMGSYAFLRTCLADKIGWKCFKDELLCQSQQ